MKAKHFITLKEKRTKRIFNGQRRGESLFVALPDGTSPSWYGLWAQEISIPLFRKDRTSFKRRFLVPEYGWPWDREPPIVDVLKEEEEEADEGNKAYVAPHFLPGIKKKIIPVSAVCVVLEFRGFHEFPFVHTFKNFDDAWAHVLAHPATQDLITQSGVKVSKLVYGEYENICDKYASRTTTIFKIHQQPALA